MSSVRLSLACPGATSAALLSLARRAQVFGLGVWLGDPAAEAENSDDSYVLATAGALALGTRDIRIGVWLTLRGSASLIRIAEDIGVIDQMSGGRLNLGLVAPGSYDPAWKDQVARLMGAWREWRLPDGRVVVASPPPAQPRIPASIVGDERTALDLSLARAVAINGDPSGTGSSADLLIYAPDLRDRSFRDWLGDFEQRVAELRALVGSYAKVAEIALVLPEAELDDANLRLIGMALAPAMRATAGDRDGLPRDAWAWATQKQAFHHFASGSDE